MKHLYDSLRLCAKEEEVKAEFCKFFKMKIFALRGIDHYTEHVLFEFKHDRNFRNAENVARVLAQTMYYARLLKYGAGLPKYPLPLYICVVDKNEAFFAETKDYAKFYTAKCERYDWDRADATERVPPAEALRAAHDALRAKLLPQVYSLGFLNPDVEYFV